jgi:hypothetical protein
MNILCEEIHCMSRHAAVCIVRLKQFSTYDDLGFWDGKILDFLLGYHTVCSC